MSDSSNMNEFGGQFLEDYYAECLEHLSLIRRHLLAIEVQISQGTVDVALLDELFRSFHTIKGISGMVGLGEAEQLAHSIEGLLRLLRAADIALTVARLDSLIAGVRLTEQLITAHRNKEPLPDIQVVVSQLQELSATGSGASDESPGLHFGTRKVGREGSAATGRRWTVDFTPTPALAERGVNINSVRARLQQAGEIVRSTPQVKGEGEISFRFEIYAQPGVNTFEGWELDGLIVTPVEDAPIPESSDSPRLAQGSATPVKPAASSPSANVVRVDLARLDELMRMIGEMVTNRARLEEQIKRVQKSLPPSDWRGLWETNQTMSRQLRDLREGVMSVRMVQVGEIFERMQFVVRDLARESGKKITLERVGRETEIDKFLVERMMDPLLHLVRNAVSHGLERPDERAAQGKSSEGRLTLRAATTGENVVIQIHDDGRGIDRDSVVERARGLVDLQGSVDDATLLDIICLPGFSTRTSADRESGRGVGMDVVKKTVEDLNGTLTMFTETGKGTVFTIELPLTLAIADALIVHVSNQTFAVPQTVVREVIEVQPSDVTALERNEIISYRDGALPLLRLSKVFNLPESAKPPESGFHVFVTGTGSNALGVAVDRVVGHREIVVRGISDPLAQSPGIAGATDLGDERVVLILDVAGLRRTNLEGRANGRPN